MDRRGWARPNTPVRAETPKVAPVAARPIDVARPRRPAHDLRPLGHRSKDNRIQIRHAVHSDKLRSSERPGVETLETCISVVVCE